MKELTPYSVFLTMLKMVGLYAVFVAAVLALKGRGAALIAAALFLSLLHVYFAVYTGPLLLGREPKPLHQKVYLVAFTLLTPLLVYLSRLAGVFLSLAVLLITGALTVPPLRRKLRGLPVA